MFLRLNRENHHEIWSGWVFCQQYQYLWGPSAKLSFWIILIKPVGGFLITLSLSTKENAIKQKQTRLNLFIIRWASWYWPVRPGKYYSSGEREKSQELVISFPKKFCQKKLFTTSRIPAQPKTRVHKKCSNVYLQRSSFRDFANTFRSLLFHGLM